MLQSKRFIFSNRQWNPEICGFKQTYFHGLDICSRDPFKTFILNIVINIKFQIMFYKKVFGFCTKIGNTLEHKN